MADRLHICILSLMPATHATCLHFIALPTDFLK